MSWFAKELETNRTETNGNIRPMEGLRGFAVLLVFAVHFAAFVRPWFELKVSTTVVLDGIHSSAQSGVDLFFFLSGFLIYGSLIARAQPFLEFVGRRVRRIYPTYFAVFVLYLGLCYLVPSENKIPAGFEASLIFIVSNALLLPGIFSVRPLITVAWSLSYEVLFYLAIPIAIAVGKLRTRSKARRVAILLLMAVSLGAFCYAYEGPIRLVMFLGGALVYETLDTKQSPRFGGFFATAVFSILVILLSLDSANRFELGMKTGGLFLSLYILCVVCLGERPSWLSKMFTYTPLRWLGNMSYSYYLLHSLVLKASFLTLAKLWAPTGDSPPFDLLVLVPLMFIPTLVLSFTLFVLIERRFSLSRARGQAPISLRIQNHVTSAH